MVRLKDAVFSTRTDRNTFQFHNGSIKREARRFPWKVDALFQFHNGSIKSVFWGTEYDASYTFQFHNGSIKSRFLACPVLHGRGFNSTMVRLKVGDSIKRSIESLFQFHNGSIKSDGVTEVVSPFMGFNSTMVRLKGLIQTFTLQNEYVSIPQWFD